MEWLPNKYVLFDDNYLDMNGLVKKPLYDNVWKVWSDLENRKDAKDFIVEFKTLSGNNRILKYSEYLGRQLRDSDYLISNIIKIWKYQYPGMRDPIPYNLIWS